MSWLSNYKYRRKITIDSSPINSDLPHFPLAVPLGASVGVSDSNVTDIFDEVGSDYLKIAVTMDDGETQLYVEVEHWDATNEKALLWVSRDNWTIAADSDTEIYLYFDASVGDNTGYVGDPGSRAEVWNSNFKAVYTMAQDPSGGTDCIIDSTGNENHATPHGSMSSDDLVDGLIGKALSFDGSDDYVSLPTDTIITGASDRMIEVLCKTPDSNPSSENVVFLFGDRSSGEAFLFFLEDNQIKLNCWGGGSYDDPISYSNWGDHVVVSFGYDGSNKIGWVDGSKELDKSVGIDTGSGDAVVGQRGDSDRWFKGSADQLRILSVCPSDAWNKANYYTQTDSLLTWTATEEHILYTFKGKVKVKGAETEGVEVNLMYFPTHEIVDSSYTTNSGTFALESYLEGIHYVIAFPPSGSDYNAKIYWGFDTKSSD